MRDYFFSSREAFGLEAFRLVGGGLKGVFWAPASREWYGWWAFFLLAALWHHHARRKAPGLDLGGGLRYAFPKSTYLSASFLHDFLIITLKFLIFRVVFRMLMGLEIEDIVFQRWTQNSLLRDFPADDPAPESGFGVDMAYSFCVFMSYEFGWWVMHWLTHKIPVLWAFHKVHHSTTKMNPLASKRVHFLDEALLMAAVGAPAGLVYYAFRVLGWAPSEPVVMTDVPLIYLAFMLFGTVRHSHIPMSFGRLEAVFSSPFMHQVHHSYKPEHVNKNFGNNLVIFDRLFGTLYRPRQGEELKFGISEEHAKQPRGLVRLYFIEPLVDVADYLRSGQFLAFDRRRKAH